MNSSAPPTLVILKLKPEGLLAMMSWAKLRSSFKHGCTSVGSKSCSGRPSTRQNKEPIRKVWQIVLEDCHVIIEEITQDMVNCANHEPDFMKTIITGDETWVYCSSLLNGSIHHHQGPKSASSSQQGKGNVKLFLWLP